MKPELKNEVCEGDIYLLPTDERLLPKFLKEKQLCAGVAKVVALPEGGNQLVEDELFMDAIK